MLSTGLFEAAPAEVSGAEPLAIDYQRHESSSSPTRLPSERWRGCRAAGPHRQARRRGFDKLEYALYQTAAASISGPDAVVEALHLT